MRIAAFTLATALTGFALTSYAEPITLYRYNGGVVTMAFTIPTLAPDTLYTNLANNILSAEITYAGGQQNVYGRNVLAPFSLSGTEISTLEVATDGRGLPASWFIQGSKALPVPGSGGALPSYDQVTSINNLGRIINISDLASPNDFADAGWKFQDYVGEGCVAGFFPCLSFASQNSGYWFNVWTETPIPEPPALPVIIMATGLLGLVSGLHRRRGPRDRTPA